MAHRSDVQALAFALVLAKEGIPMPVSEHKFHPKRKWRFDYAWPEQMIALEVEGGVWIAGRHTRASGYVKDMEKYNEAACLGWLVLKCQPKQLISSQVLDMIQRAMKCR